MNSVRRLGNTRLIALFGVFGLLVIGLMWWSFSLVPKTLVNNKNVACTTEAKICPDGSAVGRIGPNCEFAKCQSTGTNKENTVNSSPVQSNSNQSDNSNSGSAVIPTSGQGNTCAVYTTPQGKIRYCSTCGDGRCDVKERCVPLDTSGDYILDSCGPLYCWSDCQTNTNTIQ